ncbi:unnamed protein product [Tilletia laevis]|uniref:VWFA domain-containing protein n=1 Tax=Tilletia laevis TaxID=157183 RepID=A0A9N8QDU9_9BASI|nr:hypothetical protein CF336_g2900 [Tilletia laevis]KAE8206157.1 hypothetical protein CF335_g2051 [Tilletia laevis]CAD6932322.1 unnamed protein product [Tilletia laevis]CAD6952227.1 unnamed protein product [Tilletia laevis]CAD6959934.1 unnamed protein product [Tilletia caries]
MRIAPADYVPSIATHPHSPGISPEVLVTLTQDVGKILTALHSSKIAGTSNLGTGINIAQLALKHRQNKNQRQRIIAFVGSTLENESDSDLIKLGKKLKKNNVDCRHHQLW